MKGMKDMKNFMFFISFTSLMLRPFAPAFEPVDPDRLSAAGSFVNAWADFDGNGDPDLFVGLNGAPNRLYRNIKGAFTDVAAAAGIADARATRAAAWGDFDADGDADLLVGFTPGSASLLKLYRNDKGAFTDSTEAAGLAVAAGAIRQICWIDFDSDGDLDLFAAFRDKPNALFKNDGGKFADVAPAIGLADPRKTVGAIWFDYDADGDLDLYVANMDGDANGLFNNIDGKFADVAEAIGAQWAGRAPGVATNGTVRPCAADINNDGRLDIVGANYGPLGLLLSQGKTFMDASSAWKVAIDGRYDTCAPADFDNDGRIDLYVNGTVTGGQNYPDYLLRNTGPAFEDVTPAELRAVESDHGAAWADFDRDGDLDLALTGIGTAPIPLLLRNLLPPAAAARSISVRVVDAAGHATMAGAEVRVYATGTSRLLGMRLVDSGSGYNAQNDGPVHVGLATLDRVDVEVTWPGRGKRTTTVQRRVDPRVTRAITVKAVKRAVT